MRTLNGNAGVMKQACEAMFMVCTGNGVWARSMSCCTCFAAFGIESLVAAIRAHISDAGVTKQTCEAMCWISMYGSCWRSEDLHDSVDDEVSIAAERLVDAAVVTVVDVT